MLDFHQIWARQELETTYPLISYETTSEVGKKVKQVKREILHHF